MKKNLILKMILTFMVICMMISIMTPVFATTIGGVEINPKKDNVGQVTELGNQIIGIVQVVGTIVAVVALLILGIKYMMGSAEEKAEYKKVMLPYVIGLILLFAGVNIVAMLVSWAQNVK